MISDDIGTIFFNRLCLLTLPNLKGCSIIIKMHVCNFRGGEEGHLNIKSFNGHHHLCQMCLMYICRLMESAREMIQESLPIKCLEAVILSLYPQ